MSVIVPGSAADHLRAEIRAALRRPEFWAAAGRELVPVLGVIAFGWEAIYAGIYFALESWLFLTTRAAIDLTDEDVRAGKAADRLSELRLLLTYMGVGAFIFAILVSIPTAFALLQTFPRGDWDEFLLEGWRSQAFLTGLALLVGSEIYASWRFAATVSQRSEEERQNDNYKIRMMFNRCIVLLGGTSLLGLAVQFGYGSYAFVVLIAVVMLYFEACPQDARRRMGLPTPKVKAAAAAAEAGSRRKKGR